MMTKSAHTGHHIALLQPRSINLTTISLSLCPRFKYSFVNIISHATRAGMATIEAGTFATRFKALSSDRIMKMTAVLAPHASEVL